MKKRFGMIFVIGLMAALGAQGASVTCASLSGGTLAALITATSGDNSCTVDDKIFTNVTYTPSTGPAAGSITASLISNSITQTYGWAFGGNLNGNFVLGYTVTIDTAICAACRIQSAIEQIFPGQNPPGTQAISVDEGGFATVNVDNAAFANNTGGALLGGLLTLTKTATATGLGESASLQSFESTVRQSPVPEPATLSLMGLSLLGLGVMRRRQQGRK